nr:hypothetical protein [uncultured Pseudodesulfovibrio sp.]
MDLDIYEDSLYGQILPSKWDNNRVSGVMILVDGEDEYIVEHDEDGESLITHVEKWATVTGIISESEEELRIKILDYSLEDDLDYISDDDW